MKAHPYDATRPKVENNIKKEIVQPETEVKEGKAPKWKRKEYHPNFFIKGWDTGPYQYLGIGTGYA